MNTIAKLNSLTRILDALLPFGHSVELNVRRYAHHPDTQIAIHGVKSYAEAQEIFRALGIQKRDKSIWPEDKPRTVLSGKLTDGIGVTVYCNGLPPSCRVEHYKERVPKKEVSESETGEFVEIERTRVVCGGEPHQEAQAAVVEVVHHLDGDTDNHAPANLRVQKAGEIA